MTGIQEDLSDMRPLRKTTRTEGSVPGTGEQAREAVGLWGRIMFRGVISLGMATAWRGAAIFRTGPFRIQFPESDDEFWCYCQAVLISICMKFGAIIIVT